jgi:hypothetical protein
MNKEDFNKQQLIHKNNNDTQSDNESYTESEDELDEFGNIINVKSVKNNDMQSLITELPPAPTPLPSRAVFNSENDYGRGMRRKYNRRQIIEVNRHIQSVGLIPEHPNASEYSRCTKIDFKKQYDETFSRGYEFQKARSIRDKKIHQENLEKINKKSS